MNAKFLLSVMLPTVMTIGVFPSSIISSVSPSAAQTRTELQTFVLPNEFSISYPAGWFVRHTSNPPDTFPRELVIITSKKPPKIGGDGLPPDVVKTDIQINPGSFETNRNQLTQVTREDGSKVTRIGKTVVGGREAYRIWSSYFGANSISTLIRYTNDETVSISSYYASQNSSAIELIQRIHGSFRSQR